MKIIETRYITVSDLRALCIKKDWYTYGTNEEYSRLFDRLKDETGNAVNMTPESCTRSPKTLKTLPIGKTPFLLLCLSFPGSAAAASSSSDNTQPAPPRDGSNRGPFKIK